ncbi:hypothetical protein [Pleionea mediterranea]|uniref:Uncharacterized protein n=1 Tax=Pleionea mediterranea TaxID=523701 RepID=A0A316F6X7_9GAMM|nr:hypothetical protein [Pleionea mediterranea]PWK41520.1 hypothetical protein C8D97_1223 [Pleionea mediterranea]
MKLSWKYLLPKQQLRPFDCFGWTSPKPDEEITDKHIKRHSDVDKAFNLGWLGKLIMIFSSIFYVPIIIVMLLDFEKALEEPAWIFGLPAVIALGYLIYIRPKNERYSLQYFRPRKWYRETVWWLANKNLL